MVRIGPHVFCVYGYFRPDIGEPFYIGKGTTRRARVHLNRSHNSAVNRVIAKLRLNNLEPEVRVLFFGTDDECKREEIRLIRHFGRRDLKQGPLVNMTDGGDGFLGKVFSKAELETLRTAAKHQWMNELSRSKKIDGIRRSWRHPMTRENRLKGAAKGGATLRKRFADPEARQRLSQQIKQAWSNPKFRERISQAMKAKMSNPELRSRLRALTAKRFKEDPTYRERISSGVRRRLSEPEFRERLLQACRDPNRRAKISVAATGRQWPEYMKERFSLRKRSLSEEDLRCARASFLRGESIMALADSLGVSYTTMYRAVYGKRRAYRGDAPNAAALRNAVERNRKAAAHKRRRLSTIDVQSLRLLRSNGVAFAKIGRQFGVSKKTVMNIVAKKIYKDD